MLPQSSTPEQLRCQQQPWQGLLVAMLVLTMLHHATAECVACKSLLSSRRWVSATGLAHTHRPDTSLVDTFCLSSKMEYRSSRDGSMCGYVV